MEEIEAVKETDCLMEESKCTAQRWEVEESREAWPGEVMLRTAWK